MKSIIRITLLFATVLMVAVTGTMAQRVIKGTVYMDGKPAAGITVVAHKGGEMMTSFDGLYEVEADAKTKWLKFTFIDDSKKMDIEGKSGDVFDFAFSGELPSANGGNGAAAETGVVLKTAVELAQEGDNVFKEEYSLYREFYKQKDYQSAFPHWKKVYEIYPKSTTNLYLNGVNIYESQIEKAGTDTEKDKIIEDYMKLYDKRIKYFGEKGFVLGRKGTSWLEYKIRPDKRKAPLEGDELKNALKVGYEWLIEAVEEEGNNTELPILVLVMQTTRSLFKLGELPKETVITNYDKCTKILNNFIATNEDASKVSDAKDKIQPYIENLFGTSGAADCEALANIFAPQFQEKGDDIEFIKSMLNRLSKARCSESQLFSDATERLYELEPSAEAAFNMARRYLNRDLNKAKEYYKQAMEQETNQDLLSTYYYEYGAVLYSKDHAYSEARSYARKALAINSGYCEANMLIGNIYVAASQKFGGSNLEKSAVFWLAVDYFNKARLGEDCSIEAAQNASKYKQYYPNKEDAFMDGLQAGQTYKVGGWINENTKVRF